MKITKIPLGDVNFKVKILTHFLMVKVVKLNYENVGFLGKNLKPKIKNNNQIKKIENCDLIIY